MTRGSTGSWDLKMSGRLKSLAPAFVAGLCLAGCGEPALEFKVRGQAGNDARKGVDAPMITHAEAVEIALNTDNARERLPKGTPIDVEWEDGIYTVTFGNVTPRDIPSADFISKIKIDAKTGRVTAKIIGN